MKQSEEFLQSEGDGFYRRNFTDPAVLDGLAKTDQVIDSMRSVGLSPRQVLEIGCGNGWRLDLMRRAFGAQCFGVEPSSAAVNAGAASYPELSLRTGTADQLPFEDASFDFVLFGFCLYLCDRQDLFRIATEADRVLADPGHVAIFDFSPPFPYRNRYRHRDGLYSFKMDYSRLFLWNPCYTLSVQRVFGHGTADVANPDDRVSVVIIRKDTQNAYPESPYA